MSKSINYIIVSVTNDLFSDQRVDKVCNTLISMGFQVTLVGRKLPSSLPLSPRNYATKRMSLLFKKGPLFYAELNFRLFWFLIFRKHSVLLANDLDTLLPNYWVSKLKGSHLVYDSHEYFTEVPELKEGSFAKKTWLRIERNIFPKLKNVYTVCESIAGIYEEKYGVEVKVVRNIPKKTTIKNYKTRKELQLPENKKILLLQGAGINIDRGSEEMVEAMSLLPDNYLFLIIGSGDIFDILKKMIKDKGLMDKIMILGRLPYDELVHYTFNADLGLSLTKDTNLNYRYSLPNKLFDYINFQTPVLSTNLVEIRKIIDQYQVGWIVDEVSSEELSSKIIEVFANKEDYNQKAENTVLASDELSWENEEVVLKEIYSNFLK